MWGGYMGKKLVFVFITAQFLFTGTFFSNSAEGSASSSGSGPRQIDVPPDTSMTDIFKLVNGGYLSGPIKRAGGVSNENNIRPEIETLREYSEKGKDQLINILNKNLNLDPDKNESFNSWDNACINVTLPDPGKCCSPILHRREGAITRIEEGVFKIRPIPEGSGTVRHDSIFVPQGTEYRRNTGMCIYRATRSVYLQKDNQSSSIELRCATYVTVNKVGDGMCPVVDSIRQLIPELSVARVNRELIHMFKPSGNSSDSVRTNLLQLIDMSPRGIMQNTLSTPRGVANEN